MRKGSAEKPELRVFDVDANWEVGAETMSGLRREYPGVHVRVSLGTTRVKFLGGPLSVKPDEMHASIL